MHVDLIGKGDSVWGELSLYSFMVFNGLFFVGQRPEAVHALAFHSDC